MASPFADSRPKGVDLDTKEIEPEFSGIDTENLPTDRHANGSQVESFEVKGSASVNSERPKSVSAFNRANFVSKLCWIWLVPYLRKPLSWWTDTNNYFDLPTNIRLDEDVERLECEWEKQKAKPKGASFMTALLLAFKWQILKFCIMKFVDTVVQMSISIVIYFLVLNFKDDGTDTEAYLLILAMCLMLFFFNVDHNWQFFHGYLIGGYMKSAAVQLIHRHALKLRAVTVKGGATGKMISLAATDCEFLEWIFIAFFLVISPFIFLFAIVLLYILIGPTSFVTVGTMIFYVFICFWIARWQKKHKNAAGAHTDRKMQLLNALIEGIRVCKMYAWEIFFQQQIHEERLGEISHEKKMSLSGASFFSIFITGHGLVLFITFSVYVWLGNEIQPETAFAVISMVYSVQMTGVGFMAMGYNAGTLVYSGAQRIGAAMTHPFVDLGYAKKDGSSEYMLKLDQLNASWSTEAPKTEVPDTALSKSPSSSSLRRSRTSVDMTFDTLVGINMTLARGSLSAIIGSVGSGKSSILNCILGELLVNTGTLTINGSLAYVEQEPWIISATVKDNILMDRPFNQERYEQVIQACQLISDLNILTHGEETMIGERGVNLSGGQKARISLARACYADTDLYLLDDPLSAVDANVRSQLFHDCISGLLKHKTVLLVTHQLHVLSHVDYVYCVEKGMIVGEGRYEDIIHHTAFEALSQTIAESDTEQKKPDNQITLTNRSSKVTAPAPTTTDIQKKTEDKKTIVDEEKETGSVPIKTYFKYWKQNSLVLLAVIVLFFLSVQVIYVAIPFWIGLWVQQDDQTDPFYIYMLAILAAALMVGSLCRNYAFQIFLLVCNKNLHFKMLEAVTRSPVTFFDANPSGRVLTRFSKDSAISDTFLKFTTMDTLQMSCIIIGNWIVMSVINYIQLGPSLVTITVALLLFKWAIPYSREVRRFDLQAKGPIYSEYASNLRGITTIRAYGYSGWLQEKMYRYVVHNMRCYFTFNTILRCYMTYVDTCITVLLVSNAVILVGMRDSMTTEEVGLSLSFTTSFCLSVLWLAKQVSEVGSFMTCVERIFQYAGLKPEAALKTDTTLDISRGRIEFTDVWMRYRSHLDYALKDFSLVIEPASKVGVVGRTGAGKSTILQTLFRLIEIEKGKISIDGQNIGSVGLHVLRSQISVIPQDPFVFPGSVKDNLDPFGQHNENALWKVLEEVELKEHFDELPDKLDTSLGAGQFSLSVGQKQLMCLARAILRQNRILVLDEATANIDLLTDQIIQTKIRERFVDCTVITVAHRINTIIDSDMVVVMDEGRCAEYDTPRNLLATPTSHFKALVDVLGEKEALVLAE